MTHTSARGVARSLLAPLAAYLGTLLTAVLVVALGLIGLAVSGSAFTSDIGVGRSDLTAPGVLLGMPFQLVAMALFGSLHTRGDVGTVSFFALPLLLTAVYLGLVHVVAARTERRAPLSGPGERAVLAVLSGLVAAVVVSVVTFALAMREAGLSLHATSVSLFFGVLVLTALAAYDGGRRGTGAGMPSWVSPDARAATGLWLGHLGLWLAGATVALFVTVWVRDGLGSALMFPVWGPTAGLYSYALGHLGALTFGASSLGSATADNAPLWDFSSALVTLLVLLASLLLGITTMLAWHLRRDARPERLSTFASWATLPATFAVGALAIWLLSTVHGSGDIGIASAGSTVQPAYWFIFVFFAWGCLLELGARYLAPQLLPVFPDSWTERVRARERA